MDPVTTAAIASQIALPAGTVAATAPIAMPAAIQATALPALAQAAPVAAAASEIGLGEAASSMMDMGSQQALVDQGMGVVPQGQLAGAPQAAAPMSAADTQAIQQLAQAPNATTPSITGPATGAEVAAPVMPGPAGPAPVAGSPQGIGEQLSQYASQLGNKMLDALPAGAVSGAGTWMQQDALAQADEERMKEEEKAQAELDRVNGEAAGKVVDWGKVNLSPEGMEKNRAEAETEAYDRLLGYGDDTKLQGPNGAMSTDFLNAMADASSRSAAARRNYAGLMAKTLSHAGGGSKLNTATLALGRELGGMGADYASIASQGSKNLGNVSPSTGAMVGGSLIQGMAPALNRI